MWLKKVYFVIQNVNYSTNYIFCRKKSERRVGNLKKMCHLKSTEQYNTFRHYLF